MSFRKGKALETNIHDQKLYHIHALERAEIRARLVESRTEVTTV